MALLVSKRAIGCVLRAADRVNSLRVDDCFACWARPAARASASVPRECPSAVGDHLFSLDLPHFH